jgi:hypothetical protein
MKSVRLRNRECQQSTLAMRELSDACIAPWSDRLRMWESVAESMAEIVAER